MDLCEKRREGAVGHQRAGLVDLIGNDECLAPTEFINPPGVVRKLRVYSTRDSRHRAETAGDQRPGPALQN